MKLQNNPLLQWNCREIRANYEELLILFDKYNPNVVYLQETFLKDTNHLNIKNYNSYNHLRKDWRRTSGSVSIRVRKDMPQHQITIDSELQVTAVKRTLHRIVNICSISIPQQDPINDVKFNNVIEQIPKPYILLSDHNSHITI